MRGIPLLSAKVSSCLQEGPERDPIETHEQEKALRVVALELISGHQATASLLIRRFLSVPRPRRVLVSFERGTIKSRTVKQNRSAVSHKCFSRIFSDEVYEWFWQGTPDHADGFFFPPSPSEDQASPASAV